MWGRLNSRVADHTLGILVRMGQKAMMDGWMEGLLESWRWRLPGLNLLVWCQDAVLCLFANLPFYLFFLSFLSLCFLLQFTHGLCSSISQSRHYLAGEDMTGPVGVPDGLECSLLAGGGEGRCSGKHRTHPLQQDAHHTKCFTHGTKLLCGRIDQLGNGQPIVLTNATQVNIFFFRGRNC